MALASNMPPGDGGIVTCGLSSPHLPLLFQRENEVPSVTAKAVPRESGVLGSGRPLCCDKATTMIGAAMMHDETHQKIHEILNPYAIDKYQKMTISKGRFVHYTSAEVAVSIIKNKEVWMRKSTTMNDYMEIEHGIKCLSTAYREKLATDSKASSSVYILVSLRILQTASILEGLTFDSIRISHAFLSMTKARI
jgi:hypothetical protein